MCAAAGDERQGLMHGALARVAIEQKQMAVLRLQYPEQTFSYADRIAAGLLGYAGGDALGLPWENRSGDIDVELALTLPAAQGWPGRGSTSDDTALTVLVGRYLAECDEPTAESLMGVLSDQAESIPGLGPSTGGAIRRFQRDGSLPTEGGNTNGAAMRAIPVGWAVPITDPERRRRWTIELSRATHPGPEAQCAACVVSACASWSLEGASTSLLLDIAIEEAATAAVLCHADPGLETALRAIRSGTWPAVRREITLDPYVTVVSAMHGIATTSDLEAALVAALRLGGDTDTVLALVGGLLGATRGAGAVRGELRWLGAVALPSSEVIEQIARGLMARRVGAVHV